MAKLVSTVYGDALFDIATETGRVDELDEEARDVLAVWQENADLHTLMDAPKIDREDKTRIIEEVFSGRVSAEMVGLMRILVEKKHIAELGNVLAYFIDRVKKYKNIGTAYVTAAFPLSGTQQQAVEERLLETTNFASLEMHYDVDKELLGGMVIRIGDRVVDSSVRTKLANLTESLAQSMLPDL